ncbi:Hypothetical protein CINCED_3A018512 [Cinara cedri]|uniref:Uncharacterized protein n=1 Tax=Cinara cedri TaxID=506608 RepID=A0A5E4MG35_9HEMI|nr:Hypothetical protein CINCED_3A018512 [Cinara cedri]
MTGTWNRRVEKRCYTATTGTWRRAKTEKDPMYWRRERVEQAANVPNRTQRGGEEEEEEYRPRLRLRSPIIYYLHRRHPLPSGKCARTYNNNDLRP